MKIIVIFEMKYENWSCEDENLWFVVYRYFFLLKILWVVVKKNIWIFKIEFIFEKVNMYLFWRIRNL